MNADPSSPISRPISRRQFAKGTVSALAYLAAQNYLGGREIGAEGLSFETEHLRLELGSDGTVRSLVSRPDHIEYALRGPIATVYRGGRMEPAHPGVYSEAVVGNWVYRGGSRFDATAVRREADLLVLEFAGARITARYRVAATKAHLAFELVSVVGPTIDRIEFLQIDVRRLPCLGEWVNFAYDDKFGVCLCSGNLQTDARMVKSGKRVKMAAVAETGVGLVGAKAILFGCPDPKNRFLDAMAAVENDFGMPPGAVSRRDHGQRMSYLWASNPDPQNIDEYITWAKKGGFRVFLLSYGCFTKGAGHFVFNDRYPNGFADLKRVTDAIRAAGLKVGLHIHYNKVDRSDPYVTPVPDPRLHASRSFTVAEAVTADAETIPVSEDPAGCTLDNDRRILRIGQELVEYSSYTSEAPFAFTGCHRGHLGTSAGVHDAGTLCSLLNVDTWVKFIRIDQNSDIQEEIADRIADIYHRTGPYDLVYFDGAEDVHEPYWYHGAAAQYRVYRKLNPPPPVCEAPFYTHYSWHMMSRANAYDAFNFDPTGMKDFCRLLPSRTAGTRALDFSRIDFGWLGGFGSGARHGGSNNLAGPDVYEYVASRGAAWDCPLSLAAALAEFKSNPRGDDCLETLKTWEDARLGNHLSDADRLTLRNVHPDDAEYVTCYEQRGVYQNIVTRKNLSPAQQRILADRREHHLFLNEEGRYELVEIEEIGDAGDGLMKAYVFSRVGRVRGVFALVWALTGELDWSIAHGDVSVMRPFGTSRPVQRSAGRSTMTVGGRSYVSLPGASVEQAKQLLRDSKASPRLVG